MQKCVPFMWAAYFCMGACKQDDVVVVIKIGALFMDACFVWVPTPS